MRPFELNYNALTNCHIHIIIKFYHILFSLFNINILILYIYTMDNKNVTTEEEKEVLVIETPVDEWDNHIGDLVIF